MEPFDCGSRLASAGRESGSSVLSSRSVPMSPTRASASPRIQDDVEHRAGHDGRGLPTGRGVGRGGYRSGRWSERRAPRRCSARGTEAAAAAGSAPRHLLRSAVQARGCIHVLSSAAASRPNATHGWDCDGPRALAGRLRRRPARVVSGESSVRRPRRPFGSCPARTASGREPPPRAARSETTLLRLKVAGASVWVVYVLGDGLPAGPGPPGQGAAR